VRGCPKGRDCVSSAASVTLMAWAVSVCVGRDTVCRKGGVEMTDERTNDERTGDGFVERRSLTDALAAAGVAGVWMGVWKDEIKAGASAVKDKFTPEPSPILGPDGKPRDRG
jgi:hypothetical protein